MGQNVSQARVTRTYIDPHTHARQRGVSPRDGLHFVGASTRPGNGVPLVLMGVKVVFEKILKLHGAGVKK